MNISDMEKLSKKFRWRKVADDADRFSEGRTLENYVSCHFAILEKLLRAWCRFTKSYSADLCYEIVGIVNKAKELDGMRLKLEHEYPLAMIGIRENGVDHPEYIKCRLGANDMQVYKAIYLLTVTIYRDRCEQRLYKAA